MLSRKTKFNFLDRGFQDAIVLIPGWATDFRIFERLTLDYNYLMPLQFSPRDFHQALLNQLDALGINQAAVLGFSLGGFIAAEFAVSSPGRVAELILVGMRRRYAQNILVESKSALHKNRRAWLYKFYLNCFSRSDAFSLSWFKKHLLKEYVDNLSQDELEYGLDYLAQHELDLEGLKKVNRVRIFHGTTDVIVPLEEAREVAAALPQAKFIPLNDFGHLPFLHPDFGREFYRG